MTHKFLKEVCQEVSKYPRPVNSLGSTYTKDLVKEFAIKNNLPLSIEEHRSKTTPTHFFLKAKKLVKLNILNEFKEHVEGKIFIVEIEKLKYINTLQDYIPILLIKDIVDIELYKDKINDIKPKAVIFSLITIDTNFYQRVFNFNMPVFSIGYKDLEYIEELTYITLEPIKEEQIEIENISFDIGRGPIVYVITSISSKDDSYGTIYSASSIALTLGIAQSFCKHYNSDFRFRFFFTEEDSYNFDSIQKHISKNLKHVYYAISVFNMGWTNKSCFYEDAHGDNSLYMSEKFYKYAKSINQNISFLKTKTMSFLHAPFKNKDVKTLMLGSYPCIVSNTKYDNIESVRFEELYSWFEILSGFLRRFHAL